MGEGRYINPIITDRGRKVSGQQQGARKVNSNKLHDIKVPVTLKLDETIRREAYKHWNGSKTAISTELFLFGLNNLFHYPEVIYKDGPVTVHVKINHDTYKRLGDYASIWKCSMRQAAHRVFMEAVKKKQLGGVTDNEI